MTGSPRTDLGILPDAEVGTQYHYKVWKTGQHWACHAKSPFEWCRTYGFLSKADAEGWGADALDEFVRNDRVYGRVR
jgi:hypothetical protein